MPLPPRGSLQLENIAIDPTDPLRRVPTRGSSPQEIDAWNRAWRSSPLYAQLHRLVGAEPGRGLSDQQRRNILAVLRAQYGIAVPSGMGIDPAGNLNQQNQKAQNIGKGIALGAAGAGVAGAAGVLPGFTGGAPVSGASLTGGGAINSQLDALMAANAAAAGGGGAVATNPSIWSRLGGFLGNNWKDVLGLGGAIGGPILGGISESKTNQRQAELAAQLAEEDINQRRRSELWDQLLQREQEARAGRGDAWSQLQQAEYVAGGGRPYTAPEWGQSYGFGPQARTAGEQAGARTLSQRSQDYLAKGPESLVPNVPTDPYTIDRSLVTPGAWENVAGLIGTGLTGFGAYQQQQQRRQQEEQRRREEEDRRRQEGTP